ncbi:MAG TPA: lamin tail domain-containing protein [Anaerolineales bacterium]
MSKQQEADPKHKLKAWMKEPAVIATLIGVIGTIIAGIITGGFGLLEARIGVRESIKATQAREATLTAIALVQMPTPTMTTILSPTSSPTLTVALTPSNSPISFRSPTLSPSPSTTNTPPPTPTETATPVIYPIAITEVMGNPCGVDEKVDAIYNEYIELFNYGSHPVNVEGLWISDGSDKKGNPDMIVPWSRREAELALGSHVITSEAVIQPNGFAVILSPRYIAGQGAFRLPYLFPRDTVILTIAEGSYLGDDKSGIEIQLERNPIILYVGNQDIVEEVISTYGTPRLAGSPKNIRDDGEDEIPFQLADCHSAERIDAAYPDYADYWIEVKDGSPGRSPSGP